jgi:hypothetical protein
LDRGGSSKKWVIGGLEKYHSIEREAYYAQGSVVDSQGFVWKDVGLQTHVK